jgi:2-pyrone-4,6-dicarboxylate lactonase
LADAVDAHCHILGPRTEFPFPEGAEPVRDWTIDDLESIWDDLGFTKAVLVQTKAYGDDHGAVLHALRTRPDRYRAVVLPGLLDQAECLSGLDVQGIRAVRFHFMSHLGPPDDWKVVEDIANRLNGSRWHLEFHCDGAGLLELESRLHRLPVPFVIDHMSRIGLGRPDSYREIAGLLRLLATGNAWVKISGADRCAEVPGEYGDALGLMEILLAAHPDRVIWGSDHPHPNSRSPLPENRALLQTLHKATGNDPDLLAQVLNLNPLELYRW